MRRSATLVCTILVFHVAVPGAASIPSATKPSTVLHVETATRAFPSFVRESIRRTVPIAAEQETDAAEPRGFIVVGLLEPFAEPDQMR